MSILFRKVVMRAVVPLAVAAMTSSVALAQSETPTPVLRSGVAPVMKGPAKIFTGDVQIRILAKSEPPGRTSVGLVTFAPGARSFWHTHPAGQTLVVTQGCGWTQQEGKAPVRICAGDTVTVPAGVRHWHGAAADSSMTHLSITEKVDGRDVDWQEAVSPADYHGPLAKQ